MKKIFRYLRSMQFGMILLALVIACSVAGSLIVQQREPMEYVNRYSETATKIILALQLDDVFSSFYYLVLMGALGLNLTLCSIVRLPKTISAAKRLTAKAENTVDFVPLTQEQQERLCAYLKHSHFKKTNGNNRQLYSKNMAGFYGSFLTHLAFLLILVVGALAVITADVQDQTVMPGDTLALSDGTTIFVEAFQIEDETGLLDYASKIIMRSADGSQEASKEIRVNEPLSFKGYKVYQQTYGTAGTIRIDNLANNTSDVMHLTESCFLTLNGVDGLFFRSLYPGYIHEEDGSVTLITSTSGAYTDPVYDILSVAEGAMTPVLAFPGETLAIGDVSFTFMEPASYPGLRIKHVSTAILDLLYFVFLLIIVGLYLCFFTVPTVVVVFDHGYAIVSPKTQTGLEIAVNAALNEEES